MNELQDFLNQLDFKERKEYVSVPRVEPIDKDFIKQLEGGSKTTAYVPENSELAGVTVGAGFDLGQRSHLNDIPDNSLKSKLDMYKGLKGEEARNILNTNPLTLTEKETKLLDDHSFNSMEKKLQNEWSQLSDVPYSDLSPAERTVMMSVFYQYGSLNKTPKFKESVKNRDWKKATKELRNFNDRYPTRRNKEADYIQKNLLTTDKGI